VAGNCNGGDGQLSAPVIGNHRECRGITRRIALWDRESDSRSQRRRRRFSGTDSIGTAQRVPIRIRGASSSPATTPELLGSQRQELDEHVDPQLDEDVDPQ